MPHFCCGGSGRDPTYFLKKMYYSTPQITDREIPRHQKAFERERVDLPGPRGTFASCTIFQNAMVDAVARQQEKLDTRRVRFVLQAEVLKYEMVYINALAYTWS